MTPLVSTGVVTVNSCPYDVWITINDGGQNTDWGCVPSQGSQIWESGGYNQGDNVTVTAEIKPDGCANSTTAAPSNNQNLGQYSVFTVVQNSDGSYSVNFQQGPVSTSVTVINNCTAYYIWGTLYNNTQDAKSADCISASGGTQGWSGNIGDNVKVQAEGKEATSCGGTSWGTTDTTQTLGVNSIFTVEQGQSGPYINFNQCPTSS